MNAVGLCNVSIRRKEEKGIYWKHMTEGNIRGEYVNFQDTENVRVMPSGERERYHDI